jgi:DNA (cytosine-5)-methyltransferase 1
MLIGSLFSGGGGGDLGFHRAGHQMAFGCEIDPKARAVLRKHNPNVPIYHDVKEINYERLKSDGIAIPQFIFGGSPCQDLSIAGNRAGLDGTRSSLFYEQIRIADELNSEIFGWENVVGSLSSNNGNDFATILGAITGHQPTPPKKGWRRAGVCVGPKRVAVWRVLNAQHFGVPQRRRRVFVIAGVGTVARRIVETLFESESSVGDFTPSGKSWEKIAADIDGRVATSSTGKLTDVVQCLTSKYRNDLTSESFVVHFAVGTDDLIVRKLTPIECERLMGWPDNYTQHGIDDDGNEIEIAPSHRYRICGNGIVANVTEWIGRRLPTTENNNER